LGPESGGPSVGLALEPDNSAKERAEKQLKNDLVRGNHAAIISENEVVRIGHHL
jgi:hypothetical protein